MDAQATPPLNVQTNAPQNPSSLEEGGRNAITQLVHPLPSSQNDSNSSDRSSLFSRPGSVSGRSTHSSRSVFLDEIKHEIMINHIYQQQCSHLWVSDSSGECEGVLLRRSRGRYLACPQTLLNSTLARMCEQLNVPVRKILHHSWWKLISARLLSR